LNDSLVDENRPLFIRLGTPACGAAATVSVIAWDVGFQEAAELPSMADIGREADSQFMSTRA
jgi:hypothetical protein